MHWLNLLSIMSVVSILIGCGEEQHKEKTPTPVETKDLGETSRKIDPKSPPKSLELVTIPGADFNDSKLIGLWVSPCSASNAGSYQWSLLQDTKRSILEKKSFVSADCKQLEISLRYYLSSNVTNKNFIGKLWEVHVFLVSKSLASAASQAESCGYKQWQAMTWYNLTNAQCKLGEKASVIEVPLAAKDSTIIQSPYTYDPVSKVLSLQVMNKISLSLSLVK